MNGIAQHIGATLRAVRFAAEMTQHKLAREVDVTESYLSALENGRREPSLALVRRICEATRCEEYYFWEGVVGRLKRGSKR